MTATTEELRDLFAQLIDHDRREGISAESTADGVLAFAKLGREKVLAVTAERDRYRSAWLSARQRAEAYGEGILRHVEDRDTWKGWEKEQAARTQQAEAELGQLREQLQESREANRALRDDNQSLSLANRELDRSLRNEQGRTNRAKEQWVTAWEGQQAAEKERDELRAQLAAAGLVPVAQPSGATELPCSLGLIGTFDGARRTHHSHTWETQPGAPLVWCPGSTHSCDTRPKEH